MHSHGPGEIGVASPLPGFRYNKRHASISRYHSKGVASVLFYASAGGTQNHLFGKCLALSASPGAGELIAMGLNDT